MNRQGSKVVAGRITSPADVVDEAERLVEAYVLASAEHAAFVVARLNSPGRSSVALDVANRGPGRHDAYSALWKKLELLASIGLVDVAVRLHKSAIDRACIAEQQASVLSLDSFREPEAGADAA